MNSCDNEVGLNNITTVNCARGGMLLIFFICGKSEHSAWHIEAQMHAERVNMIVIWLETITDSY